AIANAPKAEAARRRAATRIMSMGILQDSVAFGVILVISSCAYRGLSGMALKEADMRRTVLALPLALALVGWLSPHAVAQDTKTARGTVSAVAADSVTVKVGSQEMKFSV